MQKRICQVKIEKKGKNTANYVLAADAFFVLSHSGTKKPAYPEKERRFDAN